ncbi:CDP-glycerol glycerophosphotransferase family protein [bacterium]|nr:CDP-glycerol glycerophosphotransferase family protein [bacterium]
MSADKLRFLFFVTKPYSFPILEPIDKYINESNNGDTAWFTASTVLDINPHGKLLKTTEEVMAYNPDAVLVPGNIVPSYWPGIKVQVFHGMDDEVKGFYNITGQFDLYCTHGLESTKRFEQLAQRYKYFIVKETGWPKLDTLFANINSNVILNKNLVEKIGLDSSKPILLYAPTFPPKYTSAYELLEEITKLKDQYQWLVKFHTLMDEKIHKKYRDLASESFKIIDDNNILPYFEISDVLITDTSSVAYEFLPLDRPIITYKAIARKDKGINIIEAKDLHGAITRSLLDPLEFSESRQFYLSEIHPYSDGNSSQRIINAIKDSISQDIFSQLKPKPNNWLLNHKIKKMLEN